MGIFKGVYNGQFYGRQALFAQPFNKTVKTDNFLSPDMLKSHYRHFTKGGFDGKGVKIGIVSAFGYSQINRDFEEFSNKFNLPHMEAKIIENREKASSVGSVRKKWALESALGLQWIHAFAPGAQKICYFADSDKFTDLFYMVEKAGEECDIVCLSFGRPEFSDTLMYEKILEQSRAFFVCAFGNSRDINYPASSSHCLCVGASDIYFSPFGRATEERNFKSLGQGENKSVASADNSEKERMPDVFFFSGGNLGACTIFCGQSEICFGTSVGSACVSGICACLFQNDKELFKKALLSGSSKKASLIMGLPKNLL